MSATLDAFEESDDDAAVVIAACAACGDEHALAERPASDATAAATVCPSCGSPRYRSRLAEVGGEDA